MALPLARMIPSAALLAFALAVSVVDSEARRPPDRPILSSGTDATDPLSGAFDCGTYAEDPREAFRHHAHYLQRRRELDQGLSQRLPAAAYVYDDVWVVENDGSLLLQGTNSFDSVGRTYRFTPYNGGYDISEVPLNIALPDPAGLLALGDDDDVVKQLGFTFSFYGQDWTEIHIGSNGGIAFGDALNPSGTFNPTDFFSAVPKLAPYFMDLDPSAVGSVGVYFTQDGDSAVIGWHDIKEYGSSNQNTFQVFLRSNGVFDFSYFAIQSTSGGSTPITVGIHPGGDPTLERISFSHGVPYTGAPGASVFEDYFSLPNPAVNETALAQRFYQSFPDSFFQYVFFTNFVQTMAGFANHMSIANDISGIGRTIFDNTTLYGSGGFLESRCNMNRISVWNNDPFARIVGGSPSVQNFLTIMGQESGHRWGSFVRFDKGSGPSNLILGRSDAHWSYYADFDHSCLEGGDWDLFSGSNYVCPSQIDYFCEIDQYLMGLRKPEEVAPIYYISSSSNNQPAQRSKAPPAPGATAFGTAVVVTIEDIIAAEGLRTPLPSDENKDLRQAFMFLLLNGTSATQAELDRLANFRRTWEDYFELSCDGRLTCNTSITRTFPVAAIHGRVTNKLTTEPVAYLTVTDQSRGFQQYMIAGGNYEFRYRANEDSSFYHATNVDLQAPGYYPVSFPAIVVYGSELEANILMDPIPTGIRPTRLLPTTLYQNYPNPFNPSTTIPYDVESDGEVSLKVYDTSGAVVRTLAGGRQSAGHYEAYWGGEDDRGLHLASGVYFYRLETNRTTLTRKMTLLK